jgi:membrane fusion protein (multidrug efflux system)
VEVDAYPQFKFTGHVDSIQSGAGARFSLFPPENASGNYVKVVQRVPVKIVLDDSSVSASGLVLGPGMSVEPKVRVE